MRLNFFKCKFVFPVLNEFSESTLTGQPNGDFDLSYIQISGKNRFGALTVLSLSQDVDEDQEDHIDAEYRLSTLSWQLSHPRTSGNEQKLSLKGPLT